MGNAQCFTWSAASFGIDGRDACDFGRALHRKSIEPFVISSATKGIPSAIRTKQYSPLSAAFRTRIRVGPLGPRLCVTEIFNDAGSTSPCVVPGLNWQTGIAGGPEGDDGLRYAPCCSREGDPEMHGLLVTVCRTSLRRTKFLRFGRVLSAGTITAAVGRAARWCRARKQIVANLIE